MYHFEPMIHTLPIYVFAPRWAPIVVNSDKITPMNKDAWSKGSSNE